MNFSAQRKREGGAPASRTHTHRGASKVSEGGCARLVSEGRPTSQLIMNTFLRRTLLRGGAAALTFGATVALNVQQADCAALKPPKSLAAKLPPTVITNAEGDATPEITLEYFALRGLGELPRLILEVTGTPYNSVFHYSGEPSYKQYAPFGQLPILRDGTLLLSESDAIARHLARRCLIDGTTLEEKARVDMYAELAKDIRAKRSAIHDMEKHADAKKLMTFLDAAEAACPEQSCFFVGRGLTLADIALFHQLHFMEEVKPGALEEHGYHKLAGFVRRFASMPNVKAYLDSPRRVPLSFNELGDRPNAGLPGYEFTKPLRVAAYATQWSGP